MSESATSGWARVVMPAITTLVLVGCTLNQRGPWVDANGRQLMGSQVIEFDGFAECGHESVIFLRFFGDQYAKDREGVLGQLVSVVDGERLSFSVLERPPPSAEGTDITHAGREIMVADDRPDYLYIRLPDGRVERWPRAEVECQRS